MGEMNFQITPIITGIAGLIVVGGTGFAVGYFCRAVLGLVAIMMIAALFMGLAQPFIDLIGNAASTIQREQVLTFIRTVAGVSAIVGFVLGLFAAARSKN